MLLESRPKWCAHRELSHLFSGFLTLPAVLADVVLQLLDLELHFVVLLSYFISRRTLLLQPCNG